MKLVVDTNVVFSLFKSDSFTNKLLKRYKLELFAPEKLIRELHKYSREVCLKARISEKKFLEDVFLLPEIIQFRNPLSFFEEKADKLISHKEDVSFLALALQLGIPTWSNDPHLKQQSLARVFTTQELVEKLLKDEV